MKDKGELGWLKWAFYFIKNLEFLKINEETSFDIDEIKAKEAWN